jgi:RNA polymerase sigma-70 factor (ECF subfamily)
MHRDKELVWRLKKGDKDALRILYVENKDFLLTLANALLHDSALAEDVVHDVFVKFTRNIGDFHLTGNLKGYFAACAANESRTILRKRKIQARTADFTSEPTAKESACPVESGETAEHLRFHMASLPDEQREAVVLHVKAGLKFREIAQIQQTTLSTAKARYRYGIDKLRVLLNGEIEK